MTKHIFIIINLLIFCFMSAMIIKLILSFQDWDGSTVVDLGFLALNLKYTLNTGINFGIASESSNSRQILLAGLAILISCGFITFSLFRNTSRISIAAGMIAGGGIANAYERLAYGGVFDYLNLGVTSLKNPFSFNIADIYIFLGAVIILVPLEKLSFKFFQKRRYKTL